MVSSYSRISIIFSYIQSMCSAVGFILTPRSVAWSMSLPAYHRLLDQPHEPDQDQRADRRDENRGPHLLEIQIGGRHDDRGADAMTGAHEFRDDGANHGGGDRELGTGKQEVQARWEGEPEEDVAARRRHGAEYLERLRIDGLQPAHRVDQHREERRYRRHDDVRNGVEAESDDQRRRNRDDRRHVQQQCHGYDGGTQEGEMDDGGGDGK